MIKLMLVGMMVVQSFIGSNVGIVKNEHYIEFENGTGYYSEDSMSIKEGSKVVVVGDIVKVVE